VIRLTGKKFSEQRAKWGETPGEPEKFGVRRHVGASESGDVSPHSKIGSRQRSLHQFRFYCFTRQPADLHARINARVDEMFRRGLVAETEQLLKRGLEQNKTAMQAIGYRQVVEHLRGERPLAETVELVKSRTRQFAKRQLTWFRRQLDAEWIGLKPDEPLENCLRTIHREVSSTLS
jgi:tRNA dimethylallyltransferase